MFHQKVRQLHLESRFLTKFDSSSGVLYFSRCHFALHPIYKACSRPECVGTFLHCNFFARPSTWESLWIPLGTLVGHVFAVNERDWIILLLRGTLKQSRNYLDVFSNDNFDNFWVICLVSLLVISCRVQLKYLEIFHSFPTSLFRVAAQCKVSCVAGHSSSVQFNHISVSGQCFWRFLCCWPQFFF